MPIGLIANDYIMLSRDVQVMLRTLTDTNHSIEATYQFLKIRGHSCSRRSISNYRKKYKTGSVIQVHAPASRLSRRKLTEEQERYVVQFLLLIDAPTYKELAQKFKVSIDTIFCVKKKYNLKTVVKPKGHAMTAATIEKRRARGAALANKIEKHGLNKLVTGDEAWFYLTGNGGKRNIQHMLPNQTRTDAEVLTLKSRPQALMIWVGLSENGIIGPIVVESGVKINSDCYIDSILKPALNACEKLYPKRDFLWHQDSAPAHASRKTKEYLEKRHVKYITRDEWLPSSPDCAPCDFWLWGYLKGKVEKRPCGCLAELENIIREECQNIPHKMVTNALKAMLARLREVSASDGHHLKKRM